MMEKYLSSVLQDFGFVCMLTMFYTAMKLLGVIDWSWWWILSPLWAAVPLYLLMILLAAMILLPFAIKGAGSLLDY